MIVHRHLGLVFYPLRDEEGLYPDACECKFVFTVMEIPVFSILIMTDLIHIGI